MRMMPNTWLRCLPKATRGGSSVRPAPWRVITPPTTFGASGTAELHNLLVFNAWVKVLRSREMTTT
jgi:hypothetical protein